MHLAVIVNPVINRSPIQFQKLKYNAPFKQRIVKTHSARLKLYEIISTLQIVIRGAFLVRYANSADSISYCPEKMSQYKDDTLPLECITVVYH